MGKKYVKKSYDSRFFPEDVNNNIVKKSYEDVNNNIIKYSEYIGKYIGNSNIVEKSHLKSSFENNSSENDSNIKNSIKINSISFDEDLMNFLNWDNLNFFIKNIDTLEAVGRGSDKSTIIKFKNEKNEEILVSMKNNYFSKYEGRIEPFYEDTKENEKKIFELSIQIDEKEIELQKLNSVNIIEIDNNTLDLMNDYIDKIKNYFESNLKEDTLDLEKSNMKTLMEANILKI